MANKQSVRKQMQITIDALKLENINVSVESYSPGDGWTRYSIICKGERPSGLRFNVCLTNSLNARECLSYLQGVYDCKRFKL